MDFDIQNTHLFQLILADCCPTFNCSSFYTIAGKMFFSSCRILGENASANIGRLKKDYDIDILADTQN